jgi:membrane-anchored mycosin MYCP
MYLPWSVPLLLTTGHVPDRYTEVATMANEQDRQIVVATEQLGLVGQKIGKWLDEASRLDNAQLGLTLLTFATEAAVTEAAEELTAEREALDPPVAAPTTYSSLDRVLGELRLVFKGTLDGWAPTVGKNRTLNGVQFKPYTHSYDEPVPVAAGYQSIAGLAGSQENRVPVGLFDTRLAANSQFTGTYLADSDAILKPVPQGQTREWWEGHATFIAGIIRRYAPSAVLDVRTALRSQPADEGDSDAEEWTMSLWDFALRLGEYQDAGISVLNLSVGVVVTEDGAPPLVLERAIAQLTPSIVVVAAAGNHGSPEINDAQRERIGMPLARNAPLYPAALDNVIAVGALGTDGQPAAFNPRGATDSEFAPWIDVWAPGVDIESAYLGENNNEQVRVENRDGVGQDETFSGAARWSGTSFSTARITAEIANRVAQGRTTAEAVREVRTVFQRP